MTSKLVSALLLGALCVGAAGARAEEITSRPSGRSNTDADATEWVAIAASSRNGGRVFRSPSDRTYRGEEEARTAVLNVCARTTGSTCLRDNTRSVPADWDVVVIMCGSDVYLGASVQGNAEDYAYNNARNAGYARSECNEIGRY